MAADHDELYRAMCLCAARIDAHVATVLACRPADGSARGVGRRGPAEVDLLLHYLPPYDWAAMHAFLARRAVPGVEFVDGDSYARSIELQGEQGSITVRRAPAENALRATVRFPSLAALPAIVARLRRVFDLAADIVPIGRHLARDPVLAPLVAARPGLRVPGAWDGFELAVRAILGQQITVAGAIRLAGRVVGAYGMPLVDPDGTLTHLFPRPEAMTSTDSMLLNIPRARAATLTAVARALVADPELFEGAQGLEAFVRRLRTIRGVGEWTAQYIALRQLREPDAFPAADIGLMRALTDASGRRPIARELLARAERWRPWRAYAAQHLWSAAADAGIARNGAQERHGGSPCPPD